jgi:hypothetical protein
MWEMVAAIKSTNFKCAIQNFILEFYLFSYMNASARQGNRWDYPRTKCSRYCNRGCHSNIQRDMQATHVQIMTVWQANMKGSYSKGLFCLIFKMRSKFSCNGRYVNMLIIHTIYCRSMVPSTRSWIKIRTYTTYAPPSP